MRLALEMLAVMTTDAKSAAQPPRPYGLLEE
jgi:hypothetical protein